MPDEALQVVRYTIELQIDNADKKKEKLRTHCTHTSGSTLMTDRLSFGKPPKSRTKQSKIGRSG